MKCWTGMVTTMFGPSHSRLGARFHTDQWTLVLVGRELIDRPRLSLPSTFSCLVSLCVLSG